MPAFPFPAVCQCVNTIKCPQSTGIMLGRAYAVIPEPKFLSSPSSDWLQLQIKWKMNMRTYISLLLISSIVKMAPWRKKERKSTALIQEEALNYLPQSQGGKYVHCFLIILALLFHKKIKNRLNRRRQRAEEAKHNLCTLLKTIRDCLMGWTQLQMASLHRATAQGASHLPPASSWGLHHRCS